LAQWASPSKAYRTSNGTGSRGSPGAHVRATTRTAIRGWAGPRISATCASEAGRVREPPASLAFPMIDSPDPRGRAFSFRRSDL
jgi:hypothetical protein